MFDQAEIPFGPRPNPVPPRRELADFCADVGRVLAAAGEDDAPALIAGMLPALLARPDLLRAEHRTVPGGCAYGRHTLFQCPDDRFTVLAMVWPAGVVSPVHDHLTWCAFGIYEGTLRETRFRPEPGGTAERPLARLTETFIRRPGDASSLPLTSPDIHAMSNPTGQAVFSIHVYGGNAAKQGPNLKRVYAPA